MSEKHGTDELAAKAADAVRQIVAEAEERAAEIIRDAEAKAASVREQAEAEAAQIKDRGEADARAQIEAAKRALDELGGTLVAAATEGIPKSETPAAEPEVGDARSGRRAGVSARAWPGSGPRTRARSGAGAARGIARSTRGPGLS